MQDNNNDNLKLVIKFERGFFGVALIDPDNVEATEYETFVARSGVAMAANLRTALKECPLLRRKAQRVFAMIDTPALVVPIDLYDDEQKELFYRHAFPESTAEVVEKNVMAELNSVALFAVNKDLAAVLADNFGSVTFVCCSAPVWKQLYKRSFTGVRQKLYAYFHDKKLEITAYGKNRFRYCNSFEAASQKDAVYFILYVWKQLGLDQKGDELHLAGTIPDKDELMEVLRDYLRNVYVINPSADYNRSAVTQIKGMPYDMMTMIIKGR